MKPEVKKALDDWAKTTNLEIIQYYNISETKSMNNILEDLAQSIWDTATEKERNRKIIAMSGNWKSLDGIIEKRASTQTAKEIFDDLDIQGIYDDYKTKADRFVITTERYAKLKKKYRVK